MAKRSIRKTDSTDTTAPAKRRRATASEGNGTPAVKTTTRSRRKDDSQAVETAQVAQVDTEVAEAETAFNVTHDQIAVRAYHIYLERGYPGDQFQDWLAAERQLREQFARPRG